MVFPIYVLLGVFLILTTSCKKDQVEHKAPIAGFTADSTFIVAGSSIQFTDQSINDPTNWLWDFGDSFTSASQNPSHQYDKPDIYTVFLTVTNSGGSDTKTKTDYITVVNQYSTVFDYEGNEYNTVKIGNQWWICQNLRAIKYNDGTDIPLVTDNTDWSNLITGAYCWGNNDESNADTYGALYNWYAVNTGKLCPTGWHVPTDLEWTVLTDYLINNYDDITSNNVGNKLKSCRQVDSPLGGDCATTIPPRWNSNDTIYGTNDFSFSALPGGIRFYNNGYFYIYGDFGGWWSSTYYDSTRAWFRYMTNEYGDVFRFNWFNSEGYSVRCIKD